ncbi:MAG: trypsin-like peptidase domain-containing protein [Oscillospiraceae bacterium]|nr:trypsin-like peptidase domain-containing protein [Oscillospiraceae bacterium]
MYEPENENGISEQPEEKDGEYRYDGGFEKESIYADAHYTPAGENTVPPRYYTPPEPKKTVKKEKSGKGGRFIALICLCLVCAILGGVVGAGFMSGRLSERVASLEQSRSEAVLTQAAREAETAESAPVASQVSSGAPLSAAQIYERACEQVVGITTEVTYTNFFGMNSSSAVSGTGFIVSADGYILTNYHVIELAAQNDKDVNVILRDGTRYVATIVGYEKYNDVAVLKIDAEGLSPVTFGNSGGISVGDTVYAVGNPLGELDFSMSTGHVSALDRLITSDESGVAINMFQIDAAVNSGNSGGPVYNAAGEVIGIVTAKYADTGVEGLGFAIPINDAVSIASDLITKGYVSGKAYMGVSIDQRYNSMYAQYWGMPLGAYVYSVESGSCADKAGVREKDIITAIGDRQITGYTDLTSALHSFSAGDTTEVTVYRGGEDITLTITFDEAKS